MIAAGGFVLASIGLEAANAAPPPAGGAPTARILLVDMRRVIGESKVGQDIQRQVDDLKKQATAELSGEDKALRAEQTQLEQQAAILAPDVKNRKIAEFKQKAGRFQEEAQNKGALIKGGVEKAQQQVMAALGPILEGIMRERGATLLLDRSAVLIAPNAIDVTDVVMQRLNMKMPTVKVELVKPPAGPDDQGQQ